MNCTQSFHPTLHRPALHALLTLSNCHRLLTPVLSCMIHPAASLLYAIQQIIKILKHILIQGFFSFQPFPPAIFSVICVSNYVSILHIFKFWMVCNSEVVGSLTHSRVTYSLIHLGGGLAAYGNCVVTGAACTLAAASFSLPASR